MKFRIVIDKEKEEEVIAKIHAITPLINELEELVTGDKTAEEIIGYDEDEIIKLRVKDVEAFYIENGKTYAAYSNKKRYRIKLHLYELEAILPKDFNKINKSNLANMKHIVRFKTSLNSSVDAEFKSGFSDYISRRCFADLKRRYLL